MSEHEMNIMRCFRRYRVEAGGMLFFNEVASKPHPPSFHAAMSSLIRDGLVVKERPRDAYSLTARGHLASLSA
jgi:hypothetical protein